MAGALSKKKGFQGKKAPPPKKNQKGSFVTAKNSKKEEISDLSDLSDEEQVKDLEEFEGVSLGDSDSGSDISEDGDNPFTDDFLQGSDGEGTLIFFQLSLYIYVYF